jgi:hypothetical protein
LTLHSANSACFQKARTSAGRRCMDFSRLRAKSLTSLMSLAQKLAISCFFR